jgi:oxaloacetate decarboxylase beta subunit
VEGQRYNRRNYLLMHAMGANTGGQLGSIIAASIMLSTIAAMGVA